MQSVHQINIFSKVLTLKQNFQKNNVVAGKTPFFAIGPFANPILFVLTLVSDRAVLYGNVSLAIVVLSTKNSTPVLLKEIFVFQKLISKLKYCKRSKCSLIVT